MYESINYNIFDQECTSNKRIIFIFEENILGVGGINLHIFQTLMSLIVIYTNTSYSKENIILLFLCRTTLNVLWRHIYHSREFISNEAYSYGEMLAISEGLGYDARKEHMKFCPRDTWRLTTNQKRVVRNYHAEL